MINRSAIYLFLLGLMILVCITGVMLYFNAHSRVLTVVFLDVGQGDAILIAEGSQQMLIDGGKDGKLLLEKLGKYMPFWDRTIETVVETHPDQDHIGGLVSVLQNYQIDTVIKTKDISESQTFHVLQEAVGEEGATLIEALAGTKIRFPSGAEAEVMYPFTSVVENSKDNSNADSVVVRLKWQDETFLFTGDLPSAQEEELIGKNIDLRADVLKVAHHGSKYSTSDAFLDKVSPTQAVISVGVKNMYGHPSPETIERLINRKVEIWRTDERGDIIFQCHNTDEKCWIESK